LYFGQGIGQGIVWHSTHQVLYKANNWWAYMTGYFDASTATLYLQP